MRVAGVDVGTVTGVAFVGDRVEVWMEVLEDNRPRITTTSVATLGSVSLLGESAVDITASSGGTPIPDWGYVRSRRPSGSLANVAEQASAGLEEAGELVKDIRAGRGTVGRLFTDEALYRELTGLVQSAETVANNINQGRGTLGRLVNDPAAARALEGSLENLQVLTARIRAGEGSLGKLLTDDCPGGVAEVGHCEPGHHHRTDQSRRRDARQAGDRHGAVQQVELDVGPARQGRRRLAAGRGHGRPAAPEQAVV